MYGWYHKVSPPLKVRSWFEMWYTATSWRCMSRMLRIHTRRDRLFRLKMPSKKKTPIIVSRAQSHRSPHWDVSFSPYMSVISRCCCHIFAVIILSLIHCTAMGTYGYSRARLHPRCQSSELNSIQQRLKPGFEGVIAKISVAIDFFGWVSNPFRDS